MSEIPRYRKWVSLANVQIPRALFCLTASLTAAPPHPFVAHSLVQRWCQIEVQSRFEAPIATTTEISYFGFSPDRVVLYWRLKRTKFHVLVITELDLKFRLCLCQSQLHASCMLKLQLRWGRKDRIKQAFAAARRYWNLSTIIRYVSVLVDLESRL